MPCTARLAGVLLSTFFAAGCAANTPASLDADLILVGRVVSVREVSFVAAWSSIDFTAAEAPAYTFEALDQPGKRIEFIGGPAACPANGAADQLYLVFLKRARHSYLGGEKEKPFPTFDLSACTPIQKADAAGFIKQ